MNRALVTCYNTFQNRLLILADNIFGTAWIPQLQITEVPSMVFGVYLSTLVP